MFFFTLISCALRSNVSRVLLPSMVPLEAMSELQGWSDWILCSTICAKLEHVPSVGSGHIMELFFVIDCKSWILCERGSWVSDLHNWDPPVVSFDCCYKQFLSSVYRFSGFGPGIFLFSLISRRFWRERSRVVPITISFISALHFDFILPDSIRETFIVTRMMMFFFCAWVCWKDR